ncbi:MAG TPA: response regulator transcription factor [Arachnia sp.]|nr:response regulator transcription factor [Arachnia sp.]HMT84992.1 response regulator transcription factor [Arachnia sp.]
MKRVLVVEDEPRLASFLERGLRSNGFAVATAPSARDARGAARADVFDVILLDLGLPDLDGLDLILRLRADGCKAPIIIVTAREDVRDKIDGLDAGANDYITKPFSFDELLARIRVQLRDGHSPEATVLWGRSVSLDLRTRRASVEEEPIELTAREFTMMEVLLRHRGQVLSREQLLSHVWGFGYDPGSNIVEVYIGRLRRKLGPRAVRTVRGMGYSID